MVTPLVLGSLASWKLLQDPKFAAYAAIFAFLAGLLPTLYEALKLETAINDCSRLAGEYKNLEHAFRRVGTVSVHKPFEQFEADVKPLIERIEKARAESLTPPDIFFWFAKRKVEKGHYSFDADEEKKKAKESRDVKQQ